MGNEVKRRTAPRGGREVCADDLQCAVAKVSFVVQDDFFRNFIKSLSKENTLFYYSAFLEPVTKQ
jgi:hypothetical protein